MPLHSDGGAGDVMLRAYQRAGGIGSGSGCNIMPPKPLEEDFLFVPPLLFVGLPSLRVARGRVVWRAILVAAGCVVIADEPDVGRSCS